MARPRHPLKSRSSTYARWGGLVGKGAVVKYYKYGGWHRGIVLRLLPINDFARAYGREAEVLDPKSGHVDRVNLGDMQVLANVKRMPGAKRRKARYR